MGKRRRRRLEPTEDWEQVELFALEEALREGGWLKAIDLCPRKPLGLGAGPRACIRRSSPTWTPCSAEVRSYWR